MVEENLRHSFTGSGSSRGSGEGAPDARRQPSASAGVAFQMFNAAFLLTPVTGDHELDQRIAIAKIHFRRAAAGLVVLGLRELAGQEEARRACLGGIPQAWPLPGH